MPGHGIPDGVEDAVMRALAKDPSARFASANEFADALCVATLVRDPMPWIARGTLPAVVFSTEATTANWQREGIVHVFGAGIPKNGHVARGRLAVNAAVVGGDGEMVGHCISRARRVR